jgi:predicted CoA-binding protein
LQSLGWRVLPVHPSADVLLGELVHASLAHITEPIDLVDVFRPAVEAPGIARAAVAAGARALWLQLGISSAEARAIATDGGLDYIEDRCAGADAVAWGLRAPRAQDPGHPR